MLLHDSFEKYCDSLKENIYYTVSVVIYEGLNSIVTIIYGAESDRCQRPGQCVFSLRFFLKTVKMYISWWIVVWQVTAELIVVCSCVNNHVAVITVEALAKNALWYDGTISMPVPGESRHIMFAWAVCSFLSHIIEKFLILCWGYRLWKRSISHFHTKVCNWSGGVTGVLWLWLWHRSLCLSLYFIYTHTHTQKETLIPSNNTTTSGSRKPVTVTVTTSINTGIQDEQSRSSRA